MRFFKKEIKRDDHEEGYFERQGQPFPPIGQRIIKTAIAVFLCLMIYVLRGYQGMIVQSCIAAIICMQPYSIDSRTVALQRVSGTILGGLWGLFFLAAMRTAPAFFPEHMLLVYVLMSIGVVLVLYSCVVLRLAPTAALAAIVYLCIIYAYPAVEEPLMQTVHRIVDTVIGVLVAIGVNTIHWPMEKREDRIFFVRLQDLVEDRYSQVSSRVLIELNRLYDDGARICLVSKWAPAFLISQMGLLEKINMPVIVMDGAALYDIRENTYRAVCAMEQDAVAFLLRKIEQLGLCCQIIAIRDQSMLIYRRGRISPEEERDHEMMKRSPYRNYVEGEYHEQDQIVQVRFMVKDEDVKHYEELMKSDPEISSRFRVSCKQQPRMVGYSGIYFYHKEASVTKMEWRMLRHIWEKEEKVKPVHIRPTSHNYDPERDAPILLHKLKKNYERPKTPFYLPGKRSKNK